MPNHVSNVITMEGITKLPLFGEDKETGGKYFDFNKLIPMPESLNIESGSRTDRAIVYYLTNRCTIPLECLDKDAREIIYGTVTNILSKNWAQTVFIRTFEWAYKARPYEQDKLYSGGEKYVNNYKNYGATTWYDWCREHWGTKWNACDCEIVDADTIKFQTAWSAPIPVIDKLAEMYPEAHIEHWWADENTGSNTGYREYADSEWSGGYNADDSDEAYECYQYCWGDSNCLYQDEDGHWQRHDCENCHGCD